MPSELSDIPLEYFAGALRWLARQPEVIAKQIYVSGVSRGSEAALLLGVHYPDLVHGVIASSPSDLSFGSYPAPGSAAWTYHGKPVPYSSAFSSVVPIVDPPPRSLFSRSMDRCCLTAGPTTRSGPPAPTRRPSRAASTQLATLPPRPVSLQRSGPPRR